MSDVISVKVVADISTAQQQINTLKQSLQNIAAKPIDINNQSLLDANRAAIELQKNLQAAVNTGTGKLDLSIFQSQLNKSGQTLNSYAQRLNKIGPEGAAAFRQLAQSIVEAEAPMTRVNASLVKFGQTIKNTINWQISSSMIHGIMGAFSSAIGYAKDLNESLNNIRIVTNQNIDQMAKFAESANKAAKNLNTTTTKYTDASLIYYQQGLDDKQVKQRTDVTVNMANAAGISAEKASEQLTAIWNNFDNGTQSLEHYADVLVKLGAETASSSDEISAGMEKFASVAETVGLSYEYAAAGLATVTATTRQSADTVGTAFKTLFARLEGLQLGETLEDGTDLNKYSAALAKVGVNIKDVSGEIKSMDTILEELGMRWQTLAKDEQIALAQTIGGMRQYTQLVAWMDNWDFFKQNLSSAQNADGALQQQADIYGESWQAASDRAKTSLQDLYDSLIDDNTIIKFTDGFSKIIDTVAGLVDGFGGLENILLSISAIFMGKFAKEIPVVLSNLRTQIQTTFLKGSTNKNTVKMQEDAILALGALNKKDRVAQAELSGLTKIQKMNSAYIMNKDKMSSAERARFETDLERTKAYSKMQVQAAQKIAKKEQDAESEALYNAQQQRISGNAPKRTKAELEAAQAEYQAQENIKKNGRKRASSAKEFNDAVQYVRTHQGDSKRNTQEELKQLEATEKLLESNSKIFGTKKEEYQPLPKGDLKGSQIRQWEKQQAQLANPLIERAKRKGQLENIRSNLDSGVLQTSGDFYTQSTDDQKKAYLKSLQTQMGDIEKAFDIQLPDGGDLASKFIEDILKQLDEGTIDIKTAVNNINNKLSDDTMNVYTDAADEQTRKTQKQYETATGASGETIRIAGEEAGASQSVSDFAESIEPQADPEHEVGISEVLGNIASTAMMTVAAIESVESAYATLADSDASQLDKITAGISAISTAAMTASSALSTAQSVVSAFGGSLSTFATGGIAALAFLLPMLLGALEGWKQQQEQILEDQYTEAIQTAEDTKATAEANREVLNSYQTQKIAYEDMLNSDASNSEILQSQSELADAALKVAEAYNMQGAAMLSLGENSVAFDAMLKAQQRTQLESDQRDYENAQEQAGNKLLRTANQSNNVESYGAHRERIFKVGFSGGADEEKARAILSKYDSFEDVGYNPDLLDDFSNFKDVDSVLSAYDDLVAARNEMIGSMTSQEMADSEVFQSVTGEIETLRETVELYRQYGDEIITIQAELEILGAKDLGYIEKEVTDLKSFSDYREKMIASMAEEQGLLDENGNLLSEKTEEYDKLVSIIDNYLRQLPHIAQAEQGNLSLINQGLDEMIEKRQAIWKHNKGNEEVFDTKAYKDAYSDLYDLFGNAIFDQSLGLDKVDLNSLKQVISQITKDPETGKVTIPVELMDSGVSERLQNILDLLQAQADLNAIQIKLAILDNFDVSTDSFNIEALTELQTELQEEWDKVLGKDFSLTDFFLMSEEEQQQAIAEMRMMMNEAKAVANEAQLEGMQDKLVLDQEAVTEAALEVASANKNMRDDFGWEDSATIKENASDITEYEELQRASEAAENGERATLTGEEWERKNELQASLTEEGYEFDDEGNISGHGITEDNIQTVLDYTDAINQLSEAEVTRNETADQVADLEAQIEAYGELGSAAEYFHELKNQGYDTDEIKNYTQALMETEDRLDALTAAKIAKSWIDQKQGIEELTKAWEDYSDAVDDIDKAEKLEETIDALEKATGIKLSKTNRDLLKTAQGIAKLEKAIKGTPEDLRKFQQELKKMDVAEALGKPLDEIQKAFDNGTLDELFNSIPLSFDESLQDLYGQFETMGDVMSTIFDALPTLDTGELITGDAGAACNALLATLTSTLGGVDQAITAMSEMGIEVRPKEGAELENSYQSQGSYQGIHVEHDAESPDVHYIPLSPVSTSSSEKGSGQIDGFEFFKKGDPAPSGGGSGGGNKGGKAKPPKPHKRIDPKVRFEGTKKRIDNLSKKQDLISSKKEAAYGREKIKQAEKEIELKQRQIKLQTILMEETKEALELQKIDVADRLKQFTGVKIEFDADGSVSNLDKVEEAILDLENHIIDLENAGADDFTLAHWEEILDMAREGFDDLLDIIEETLDAEKEFWDAINELNELVLQDIQYKVELNISIDEAELEYIDYMLEKLSDEGFEAAESISVLGQKAENALSQIDAYSKGISDILATRGISVSDLISMDADDLIGLGFTQDEIDALLEYRSAIIENMTILNELRTEITEKVSSAFSMFSDELSRQIELFEHYNGLLEHFREIASLTGSQFAKNELRDIFSAIDKTTMNNAQANIRAAKENFEIVQAMYEDFLQTYNEATATQAEREAKADMEEVVNEAQETFYASWEEALSKATDILEQWVEDAGARFEEVLSPMYQSLDRLEEAYDRMSEQDENYYDNYEQLYHLSQLIRDISNSIDDTDNIKGKQRLRDLMKEITDIQARGVELSEYDVDILRKRYELEQARQALEDAEDNASLVRLQRDQEGNWGYVYTADEDAVDEAEKEYENKLYELQKANDEYIKELQDSILDLTTDCKKQLAEIAEDTALSPEEKDRLSQEIMNFYNSQLEYLTSQMDGALANQNATLGLMLNVYNTTKDQLLDTWEETNLSLLGIYNNTGDMFAGLTRAMNNYMADLWEGIQNFDNNLNNTNIAAGGKDTFGVLADEISKIGGNTEETEKAVESLGKTFVSEFETIMAEVTRFEEVWGDQIDSAIDKNEEFVSSLLEVISLLALVNTDDKEFTDAYNEYKSAQQKYLESLDGTVAPSTIRYGLVETNNPEWEAAKKKFEEFMTQWMAKHSGGIMDSGEAFDTGGYTGEWGPDGRLAWLHQKELILNATDTENLLDAIGIVRALELNVDTFTNRLADIMPMVTTMEREAFQQEIYITAEFPDATSAMEIQEAFENLINDAAQYAYQR